jgi:hypothetical protein
MPPIIFKKFGVNTLHLNITASSPSPVNPHLIRFQISFESFSIIPDCSGVSKIVFSISRFFFIDVFSNSWCW